MQTHDISFISSRTHQPSRARNLLKPSVPTWPVTITHLPTPRFVLTSRRSRPWPWPPTPHRSQWRSSPRFDSASWLYQVFQPKHTQNIKLKISNRRGVEDNGSSQLVLLSSHYNPTEGTGGDFDDASKNTTRSHWWRRSVHQNCPVSAQQIGIPRCPSSRKVPEESDKEDPRNYTFAYPLQVRST